MQGDPCEKQRPANVEVIICVFQVIKSLPVFEFQSQTKLKCLTITNFLPMVLSINILFLLSVKFLVYICVKSCIFPFQQGS